MKDRVKARPDRKNERDEKRTSGDAEISLFIIGILIEFVEH